MLLLNRDQTLSYFSRIKSGSYVKANDNDYKKVFVVETKFTENEDEYRLIFVDFSSVTIKYRKGARIMLDDSGMCLTEAGMEGNMNMLTQK